MSSEMTVIAPTRRAVLKSAASAAFLYAFTVPLTAKGATTPQSVGAFVRIAPDGKVTILVGVAEMGQGVSTGVAQVLAGELCVDWADVTVEMAPADPAYANPAIRTQATFGSLSMRGFFAPMRRAGATVREMLKQAASEALGVPVSSLTVAAGRVIVAGTSTGIGFGALAARASQVTPPANAPLLADNPYIGASVRRADIPQKLTGQTIFGTDVRLPDMLYATVIHSPVVGGTVPLGLMPPVPQGAVAIVPMTNSVGVVARDTWSAMQAARRVSIPWQVPVGNSQLSSASILQQAQQLMSTAEPLVAETAGAAQIAHAGAIKKLDVTYSVPYLAHACMEVLSCTALVTTDSCTVWAPTQAQAATAATAVRITGLPAAAVSVNSLFLGGGLGRKVEQDFVAQAVTIAKAMPGKPVKLIWTREQDFLADMYRPVGLARVRAGFDSMGNVNSWWSRLVAPSSSFQRSGSTGVDFLAIVGATGQPYAIENRLIEYVRHPSPVPVGSWRSIGYSINTFVAESAMDELASLGGVDPLALRRKLLAHNPRALAVLNAAASLGEWDAGAQPGRAKGLAFCFADNSYVAQVVEISQPTSGVIAVHKVACAVDCGLAVNPDGVIAQIEGGIVHGLSSALWGEVTFSSGRPNVRNFNTYRILRLRETPVITVKLIDGDPASLGGAGEVSVPPVAPALANAWARLTGQRLRALPLFPRAVSSGGGGEDEEDDD